MYHKQHCARTKSGSLFATPRQERTCSAHARPSHETHTLLWRKWRLRLRLQHFHVVIGDKSFRKVIAHAWCFSTQDLSGRELGPSFLFFFHLVVRSVVSVPTAKMGIMGRGGGGIPLMSCSMLRIFRLTCALLRWCSV